MTADVSPTSGVSTTYHATGRINQLTASWYGQAGASFPSGYYVQEICKYWVQCDVASLRSFT
jgi:hypothetical protein